MVFFASVAGAAFESPLPHVIAANPLHSVSAMDWLLLSGKVAIHSLVQRV